MAGFYLQGAMDFGPRYSGSADCMSWAAGFFGFEARKGSLTSLHFVDGLVGLELCTFIALC